MTVGEIIEAVRLCYDEEDKNPSSLAYLSALGSDNTLMNNIIKNKIGDAVRWLCLYSPAELLGGSDEPESTDRTHPDTPVAHNTGILVDVTVPAGSITPINYGASVSLESDFIKLARVRVSGWNRAVKEPLREDSEEYLQIYDENGANATYDRPQAAIIDKATKQLEVWPWTAANVDPVRAADTIEYTYVASTDADDFSFEVNTGTAQEPVWELHYALPPRVKTAFIYYLAFLVLSAYEDSRAARMLEIAKMNIGK